MKAEYYELLRYPHVTEKSTIAKEQGDGRVVVFKVKKTASKHQIREAIEAVFEVKVEKIRTSNFQGKVKRQGRTSGRRPAWKKAYVTLKPGQKEIEFY